LQILNQTPTYRRSIIENEKIDLLIKKLLQMKLRVGRTKKEAIGKHRIGRMVGQSNSFKVFSEIICNGDAPSLIEVFTAIKQTKDTKIGKGVSIIKVPVDMLEHCCFGPFAQNTKAFITSRFETLCGLKNKNGELEMNCMGEKKGNGRKEVTIPRRMFVDGKGKKYLQEDLD
jgi:hypothetical protein